MWDRRGNDRLAAWRKFRLDQATCSEDQQIANTIELWKYCHIGSNHYDYLNINDWPTPWELILDDNYDDFSRALGMAWTLVMIDNWNDQNIYLRCYKDMDHSCFYHVVELKDKVINYNYGKAISRDKFPQSARLICEYNYIDLSSKSK
jgi:hypothetical protein